MLPGSFSDESKALLTSRTALGSLSATSSKGAFIPPKQLTCSEYCICCCTNIPCSCSKVDWQLRDGKYTVSSSLIAYRGDSRSPEIIFSEGFSAYAISRPIKHLCCNGSSCLQGCCVTACGSGIAAGIGAMGGPAMCGLSAGLGALYAATGFSGAMILGACCEDSCTPTVICGQRLYKAPYVANWSALSLTLSIEYAVPYISPSSPDSYSYCIYMEGCIRYDELSKAAIADGAKDPTVEHDSPVFDAKEVFPPNPRNQTIAPEQIFAAKENKPGGRILFNTRFAFFGQIKPCLERQELKLDSNNSLPAEKMGEVLKVYRTELGIGGPPTQRMA